MSKLGDLNSQIMEKSAFSLSLLVVITMIFTSPLDSFAEEDTSLSWQLLFIKQGNCGPEDNLDELYSSLTSKYFELYQLENKMYDAFCISESEYNLIEKPDDVNLTILVYDEVLGKELLQPNNLDGIYAHSGNNRSTNHLVILCHCSDYDTGYESTLPSWILSHEISHFVLSYKGFSQAAIEDNIHEIEEGYDNCVGTNFGNEFCDEFTVKIRPDSISRDFVMMVPFEPAVGNKLIKHIPDDYDYSEVIDLQRELARMWVTNMIDDEAYSNALKHIVDSSTEEDESHDPLIEIPNGFVIAEKSKPKEVGWDEYLEPTDSEQSLQSLLGYIQLPNDNLEEINIEQMPTWFKTRALLWSEKRISDKVFFDGVEHLVRMGVINLN